MENEQDLLFKDITEEWLSGKRAKIKKSTYYQYVNLIQNHIEKTLGELPVNAITNQIICDFFNKLTCDSELSLSTSTVKSIIYITKAVIRYAVKMNFMEEIRVYFESPGKSNKRDLVLTHQEEKNLTKYLLENRTLENVGILLAMYTGIRLGELCALQWGNISLSDAYIYIEKTVSRLPDNGDTQKTRLMLESPKSFTSIRYIPLPDFLVNVLSQFAEENAPEDFLLTGNAKKIPDPRTMQNKFKTCEMMAGITIYNFHTLRHTFATRCVELGFDVKSLSEILGHASVNITLNRYVHSSLDMKRKQMLLIQQGWCTLSGKLEE